ncbi:BioY protein [Kribbella flavida DSM 17836]|uniref:Biotin transporter n=1 Tax=Kribbella flavida (strain DSM 17836 / JCM 10339 / NBRC 14399) TaxID=479435 RepID=D2PX59_KRIFD|nr:biotin transporter BioY [Kribbella flavida]ADB29707.1 BioY protein [Kribbella flavida DSM 17836]
MTTAVPLPAQRPIVLADVLGRSRTRDAVLVLTAALFTAALAQIAIPVPGSPVPITGQTLAVVLTAAALGPHRGLAGQGLYLLLGAVGLPFYSEASGGFEVIAGATGGYLIGFLPAAYLIGLAARHQLDRAPWKALPLFIAGQAIIFAVGVPWLAVTADLSASAALDAGFYPFVLGGLIKAAVAGVVLPGLWKLTDRTSH